jgi:hypothetical protein
MWFGDATRWSRNDVIGKAILMMKIATGKVQQTSHDPGTEANRKDGYKG